MKFAIVVFPQTKFQWNLFKSFRDKTCKCVDRTLHYVFILWKSSTEQTRTLWNVFKLCKTKKFLFIICGHYFFPYHIL